MELQCYENQTENRTRLRTQLNQKKFILAVEFGYGVHSSGEATSQDDEALAADFGCGEHSSGESNSLEEVDSSHSEDVDESLFSSTVSTEDTSDADYDA